MLKQVYIVSIIFLILHPGAVYGQSTVKLYGTVLDEQTGLPVDGANITVAGTGYGASTDPSGHFEIENLLEGVYTITATHIGYHSQVKTDIYLPRDQMVRLRFSLKPKILQFEDILITADQFSDISRLSTYRISEVEIKQSNAQTVAELLETIPGVMVISTEGHAGSRKISIRGSQSNQVLILIDDVPVNNALSGEADLSLIPISMVERVDVIKGGASNQYGSGAIGGVVHVITKRHLQNKITLNSGYGSFDSYWFNPSFSAMSKRHHGTIGITTAYQYQQTAGRYPYRYTDSGDNIISTKRLNAEAMNRNGFARLHYAIHDHRIYLNVHRLLSDRGIPGKIDSWTPFAHTHLRQTNYGAAYEYCRKNWRFSLNSQYSKSQTENKNIYSPDTELKYRRVPQYHYQYLTNTMMINASVDYQISKTWNTKLTYNRRSVLFKDENYFSTYGSSIEKANDHSDGISMHHDYQHDLGFFDGQLQSMFDIRYDRMTMSHSSDKRIDQQWSPGTSFNLSFGEKTVIYTQLSFSRSFRVPTFADLFYQDTRVQGKPDLLPEKALHKEITFGFKLSETYTLLADIHVFSQKIDDLIVWRLGSFEVFRPFNTDAEINGEEYNIQFTTPADHLKIDINYLHIRALNKENNLTTFDNYIPYRPVNTLKARFEWNVHHLRWQADYRFVGVRYITEANTKALPAYNVLDSTLMYTLDLFGLNTTLKLSTLNLSNEVYHIVRDMPLPGREWRCGVDVVL